MGNIGLSEEGKFLMRAVRTAEARRERNWEGECRYTDDVGLTEDEMSWTREMGPDPDDSAWDDDEDVRMEQDNSYVAERYAEMEDYE